MLIPRKSMIKNSLLAAFFLFIIVFLMCYDQTVALYFHETNFFRDFFEFVTQLGKAEFYLVPSGIIYLIYRKRRELITKNALLVFWSVVASGIAVNILKILFARYRPKMLFNEGLYDFTWFNIGYSFASFPSGHSTTTFSGFIALAFIWPKWRYFLYAAATLIAFSRVAITAHYPSDVCAGALLGTVSTVLIYKKYFKENNE